MVSFEARFGGVGFAVQVPVRAILGIYARETGQGMIFPEGDADPDPTDSPPASPSTAKAGAAAAETAEVAGGQVARKASLTQTSRCAPGGPSTATTSKRTARAAQPACRCKR